VLLLGAVGAVAMIGQSGAGRLVTPPPGTPDLAAMAIRGSDLPGARVTRQGYSTPAKSFVASYQRTLDLLPFGPTRLIAVQSEVNLARSSATAQLFVSLTPLVVVLFDPKKLARSFASTFGIRPTHVGISKARRIRAGDEGYEATVTIRTEFDEIRTLLVFVQVDRVVDVAKRSQRRPVPGRATRRASRTSGSGATRRAPAAPPSPARTRRPTR
jgi:hypothetical protein